MRSGSGAHVKPLGGAGTGFLFLSNKQLLVVSPAERFARGTTLKNYDNKDE